MNPGNRLHAPANVPASQLWALDVGSKGSAGMNANRMGATRSHALAPRARRPKAFEGAYLAGVNHRA